MYYLYIYLYLIIFIGSLVAKHESTTICPNSQLIKPCVCTQRTNGALPDITCAKHDVDMPTILANIRQTTDTPNSRHDFGRLFWTNGRPVNLTASFFDGVSFEHIFMGTRREYCNVHHISPDAFTGISDQIKTIVIRSHHLYDEISLFRSLSSLTNVETIGLEGKYIQTIPANAFRTPDTCPPLGDCVQRKLKSISFRVGVNQSLIFLSAIESHAFADLPNLQSIDVSSHDISRLEANAFAMNYKSDQLLTIDLSRQWDRHMRTNSFADNTFDGLNRPVFLDLYGNRVLLSLTETVFRQLLESDSRNRIRLGMKMDCDCDLYWLWRDRQLFSRQFIEWHFDDLPESDEHFGKNYTILCSNGEQNFWYKNQSDFSDCQDFKLVNNKEL